VEGPKGCGVDPLRVCVVDDGGDGIGVFYESLALPFSPRIKRVKT
jgi:hypothetical protein